VGLHSEEAVHIHPTTLDMTPEEQKLIDQFKGFVDSELSKYDQTIPVIDNVRITNWDELFAAFFGCMIVNSKGKLYVFSKEFGEDLSYQKMKDIADHQHDFETLSGYRFITKDVLVLCLPPQKS